MMEAEGAEVRRHYRVEGRVQGVGFRWWTARTAREGGLRGTVRNRPDGAVEVEVAGDPPAVNRFRAWLEEGPLPARVDRVQDLPPSEGPLPEAFEIVR